MKRYVIWCAAAACAVSLLTVGLSRSAFASCGSNLQSCSSSYGINGAYFGSGGQLGTAGHGCSSSYCAGATAGELAVGNATNGRVSGLHQVQAGDQSSTEREPSLSLIVNGTSTDLGYLSTASTAHTTATFSVKSYLASGYTVQTVGNPPVNNATSPHTLSALTGGGASSAGSEQFGINLAANTTGCGAPANFGAAPIQVPDSTFSFGAATSGYNTCGSFKYNSGDTIASSSSSSGETDYTISYIFNISSITPDGRYTFNQSLVATSTF